VTQAADNLGRTVGYTYNASGELWKVKRFVRVRWRRTAVGEGDRRHDHAVSP
jgi:hypothetical protein